MKQKTLTIILLVVFLLSMTLAFVQMNGNPLKALRAQTVNYVYTDELGTVKTQSSQCDDLCQSFDKYLSNNEIDLSQERAITFQKSTYSVGDKVNFQTTGFCNNQLLSDTVKIDIESTTEEISTDAPIIAYTKPTIWTSDISFVARKAGTYKILHITNCLDKADIKQTYVESGSVVVNSNDINCPADEYIKTVQKSNYVYCSEWRTYALSGTSCISASVCRNYQTICPDGYTVTGTNLKISDNDAGCQQIKVTEPTPVPEQQVKIPDCTADIEVQCSDGSHTTIKKCIAGSLQDTGSRCPSAPIQQPTVTPSPYIVVTSSPTPSPSASPEPSPSASQSPVPQPTQSPVYYPNLIDTQIKSSVHTVWMVIGIMAAVLFLFVIVTYLLVYYVF